MVVVAAAVVVGARASAKPDGPQVAYLGHGTIYLDDADSHHRRTVVSGVAVNEFAWSPDGRSIAYTQGRRSFTEGAIEVVKADGSGSRRASGDAMGACCPTWSPNGEKIAFTGLTGAGRYGIFVRAVDGTREPRQLTDPGPDEDVDDSPDWSPDGKWIVFERYVYGDPRTEVMAVHPDGSGLHRIVILLTGSNCACLDWSPDGKRIVYEAGSGRPEIWVMDADGASRTQLTNNRVADDNPDWSPDGTKIAFYTGRAGNAEIWVIDADGSHPRRLTRDPWNSRFPRWRPAG